MDPKLSNLDPKLKEAYDRVMNGPAPSPVGTNSPVPPAPNPVIQGTPPSINPVQAPSPVSNFSHNISPIQPPGSFSNSQSPAAPSFSGEVPNINQAPPTQAINPTPAINSTIAFNASNAGKNQGTTPAKHGGSRSMMPILIGLGVIGLLAAYTFVWVIVFDLKLPFLP